MAYILEVQGEHYDPTSENQNWGPALQLDSPFGNLRQIRSGLSDIEASTFEDLGECRHFLFSLRLAVKNYLEPNGFDCKLRVRNLSTDTVLIGPL